jgi:hypothetical protein
VEEHRRCTCIERTVVFVINNNVRDLSHSIEGGGISLATQIALDPYV